mgnify:CR=1 FL=1
MAANRSEIAIRIFRAATELGLKTVAVFAQEDRFCMHRFKADEAYLVGKPGEPIRAYLDIPGIVDLARDLLRLSGLEEGVDMDIAFTGVRPGEKLYEELSYAYEDVRSTSHPKVMQLQSDIEAVRDLAMADTIRDLVVNRSALDRIIESGGFISVNTGSAVEANTLPIFAPRP